MLEINATSSTLFLYNGISEEDGAAADLILAARAQAQAQQARKDDSEAASRRLERVHNRKVEQMHSQIRREQARLLAAKAAKYDNDLQRQAAIRDAHAGMLAAHMALKLVTEPPASSQSTEILVTSV
ncbi:hypothetical protein SFA35_11225 [Pseudomonas sp. HR96]|uniref:hypothetical protein n=1 Tax=Pseudomonas sp. HR96 TaxID=1027966 RepID=UPI002A75C895|nr:hypothetical protein [Pseudomonas sp. HR96]WPP01877.1 hypothetical protein SFA35_11225 [Pseudomonas sp. HR96]